MDFELKPRTEAGVAFVTLAGKHAEEFAHRTLTLFFSQPG